MAKYDGKTPAALIDDIGHAVAERYRVIEDALAAKLRKHLEDTLEIHPDASKRLAAVRDLRQQAERLLESVPPDQLAAIATRIMAGEASAEIARQLFNIPALASSGINAGGLYAVAAAEIDMRDSLRALNERILRAPADAYQAMTASTLPDMLIGRATWQQVQRRQVDRYLADGITGFIDAAGRRWSIGSYSEMATRTAAARAWRDQSVASMSANGIETFRIAIGVDACTACAAWAGKVLTNGTTTGSVMVEHAITAQPVRFTIDATLAEARAAGWGHPNCRCTLVAALPGLSTARQTTHDPAAEAARDQQRALERDVRDARRDGTPDDVRDAQKALREHVEATGRGRRSFREQLAFADGQSGDPTSSTRRTPSAPTKPRTWVDDLPRLDRAETYAEATYGANPGGRINYTGFYPDSFINNCHQVVEAMEMRARGFDVIARETAGRMGRQTVSTAADWLDPKTGGVRQPSTYNTRHAATTFVKQFTDDWPDGARGFVSGSWKTGGAHIFNVAKIGGKMYVYEGQIPMDADNHLSRIKAGTAKIMRVDDLEPADRLADKIVARPSTFPVSTRETQRAYIEARITRLEADIELARSGRMPHGPGLMNPVDLGFVWLHEIGELRKVLKKL